MTLKTESPRWYTSSYSNNGGACVEVATNLAATALARRAREALA